MGTFQLECQVERKLCTLTSNSIPHVFNISFSVKMIHILTIYFME